MNVKCLSLFGQETEMAVTAVSPDGTLLSSGQCASLLFEQARLDLPHLPCDGGQGMFLATGGRFYPDSGDHPEITTPEVSHPSDIVRYTRAGEAILAGLAKSLQAGGRVRSMRIFRHNANYGPDGFIAWGTHESYLVSQSFFGEENPQSKIGRMRILIPFLISRILFTGSGGFNSRFPGIEFLISPRVAHLTCPVSANSTTDRPILHFRPESLTREDLDYGRLHLVCGESNLGGDCSLWLKFATTSLIVTMHDAGIPLPDLWIENPVGSMNRFARDWKLRHRARTANGTRMSAIEIQRSFLAAAENAVDRPEMPPWTREVLEKWRTTLDSLSQSQSAGRLPSDPNEESLDWRIKHALFSRVLTERGFTWKEVRAWNAVMSGMLRNRSGGGEPFEYPSARAIERGSEGYPRALLRAARHVIGKLGLQESRMTPFLLLRDALQELDIRLMEVGDEGLFTSIELAGCNRHRMESCDSIREAIHQPPSGNRATLRGRMITRLHKAGMSGRFVASWEGIRDTEKNRRLDLGDPHESRVRWIAAPEIHDPWQTVFGESRATRNAPLFPFGEVLDCYDAGDYRTGWQMLEAYRQSMAASGVGASDQSLPFDYLRFRSWFAARMGLAAETFDALEQLNRYRRNSSGSVAYHADNVLAVSNLGLAGHDTVDGWIQSGFSALGGPESADAAFLSNAALRRLRTGDTETARRWLDLALQPDVFRSAHPHTQARILAHRGECSRRDGRLDEADSWLRRSEDAYLLGRFNGDHADYCLLYRAKLDRSLARDDQAMGRLERALAIQTGLGNPGQLRTRLLMAQIRGDSSETTREAVAGIARQFPAFEECPRFRAILEPQTWSLWCQGHLTGPLADAV